MDRYTDEEGNRKGNNNKIIYLFNDFPLSSYHLLPPPLPIPLSHPPLLLFFLSLPLLIHHLHLPFPPLTYILFPPLPSHPPSLIPIPLKPFLHLNFPQKSILPYSFHPFPPPSSCYLLHTFKVSLSPLSPSALFQTPLSFFLPPYLTSLIQLPISLSAKHPPSNLPSFPLFLLCLFFLFPPFLTSLPLSPSFILPFAPHSPPPPPLT